MLKADQTIQINFTGGIVPAGQLMKIVELAADHQCRELRFGHRQQLMLDIPVNNYEAFMTQCHLAHIPLAAGPNIVSSYLTTGLLMHTGWLTEGVYKEIFDQFDYHPALKVNICEQSQTFVPLFTGHINWVSSAHSHYWYLYLRLPGTQELMAWPMLVYSNHIAALSKAVEQYIHQAHSLEGIYEYVTKGKVISSREKEQELSLPPFHLPYYEGFNQQNNGYWLGIYKRNEYFSVPFLKDMCAICQQTMTGAVYITPWKSLVIQHINKWHRQLWDYILGKHGINVRHAANELNWCVEDDCEDGLVLKRHIIRYFDSMDTRTYGLCFSVRVRKAESLFGSIVIRRQQHIRESKLKYMQRYDILHTAGFNANSSQLVLYREAVSKEHLGPYVAALCKAYYEQKSENDLLGDYIREQQAAVIPAAVKTIYQCSECQTVYDEAYGDPDQGVQAGTLFNELPAEYCCSVCDAPVTNYAQVLKPA
ncbi:Rubredoxin [Chitinophaga jiangningensis]|uniref:Rubredoxin n=1 Tax=Chitinophaga jiangningensis TaxID=1419482 RepID=A0A1M7N1S7_9BACT|nr:rubredoxin [Chitinophaga jiangningensis]SHM97465.1 Rubredoxin [Chitinophaga jiangningensis]